MVLVDWGSRTKRGYQSRVGGATTRLTISLGAQAERVVVGNGWVCSVGEGFGELRYNRVLNRTMMTNVFMGWWYCFLYCWLVVGT